MSMRRARRRCERRLAAIEELARKNRVAPQQLPERARGLQAELDLAGARRKRPGDAAQGAGRGAGALPRAGAAAVRQAPRHGRAALAKTSPTRMQTLGMAGGRFESDVTPAANRASPRSTASTRSSSASAPTPVSRCAPWPRSPPAASWRACHSRCRSPAPRRESRCMVFDEVDSGIGGAVAEIVGRELRALGAQRARCCA